MVERGTELKPQANPTKSGMAQRQKPKVAQNNSGEWHKTKVHPTKIESAKKYVVGWPNGHKKEHKNKTIMMEV